MLKQKKTAKGTKQKNYHIGDNLKIQVQKMDPALMIHRI